MEIEQPKRAAAGRRQGTGVETEQQKRASGNFVLGIVYDRFRPGDLGVAGVEIEQPKRAAAGRRQGTGVETEQQKRASGNFVLGIVYNRFQHPGSAWRRVVFAPSGASESVITHYPIQSQRVGCVLKVLRAPRPAAPPRAPREKSAFL